MLLGEDREQEVGVLVWLGRWRDDDGFPGSWNQLLTSRELAKISENQVQVLDEEVLFSSGHPKVLKLYVPCKWVQGPSGGGQGERWTPTVKAQLGKVRGTPVRLAGNSSVVASFPDSHPGPIGWNPDPVAPRPFTEFHPGPSTRSQGWGGCLFRRQAPAFSVPPLGSGKGRKRRSDPQDG